MGDLVSTVLDVIARWLEHAHGVPALMFAVACIVLGLALVVLTRARALSRQDAAWKATGVRQTYTGYDAAKARQGDANARKRAAQHAGRRER